LGNWREINEAVDERAECGKQLLRFLSEKLTSEFGKGYDESNLRKMRQFHQASPRGCLIKARKKAREANENSANSRFLL